MSHSSLQTSNNKIVAKIVIEITQVDLDRWTNPGSDQDLERLRRIQELQDEIAKLTDPLPIGTVQ